MRLQVAIALGKIGDPRAVPALLTSLRDKNDTVRGAVASSLGQIGDLRAQNPLRKVRKTDASAFVRRQAKQALRDLASISRVAEKKAATQRRAPVFVSIGQMTAARSLQSFSPPLTTVLENALSKEFQSAAGVRTTWPGGLLGSKEVRRGKVKAYVLDGGITKVSHVRRGSMMEISCDIRVSLATLPKKSLKAFYSGGASVAVPLSIFKRSKLASLYHDVLRGAAQGAREHIVASYLRAN